MNAIVLPDTTWPDDPLPLVAELAPPAPYPLEALPAVLATVGADIQRTTQAPDAIVGNSLLAAVSLASQHRANVTLPHGSTSPLSLFVASIAESGERKSAVDRLVLQPHRAFEKRKMDEVALELATHEALPRAERNKTPAPAAPIFLAEDGTIEGLVKLLHRGLPSVGLFSAEGGGFTGNLNDENTLRTAAGLSKLWDGSPIDRVRSLDGAIKLYNRRAALHLMLQPKAAAAWLSNETLRDQGLFSRTLVAQPKSTAGTRMFCAERCDELPAYGEYIEAMRRMIDSPWSVNGLNELDELPCLGIGGEARRLWITFYNEIEAAIPGELAPVRPLASKAAEHIARMAGCFAVLENPDEPRICAENVDRAASLMQFYLAEALRLAEARPISENTDTAAGLLRWLRLRGKSEISLVEITQYATPTHVRKADVARRSMAVLMDHHIARPTTGVEFQGRIRSEAWEVRL